MFFCCINDWRNLRVPVFRTLLRSVLFLFREILNNPPQHWIGFFPWTNNKVPGNGKRRFGIEDAVRQTVRLHSKQFMEKLADPLPGKAEAFFDSVAVDIHNHAYDTGEANRGQGHGYE